MSSEKNTELLSADETAVIRAMLGNGNSPAEPIIKYLDAKDARLYRKKIIFRILDIVGMLVSAFLGYGVRALIT